MVPGVRPVFSSSLPPSILSAAMRQGIVALTFVFLVAPLVGPGLSPVQAQTPTSSVERQSYVKTFARPGEATQTVYVWGGVDQPGIWKIEPQTGLVELFSVVNPSRFGVETTDTRSEVMIRIHRTTGGQTEVVHEMKLDQLLEMRPSQRPMLKAEDVIEVRTIEKRKFSLQRVSTIVGTLSSLTLLAIRIFDL